MSKAHIKEVALQHFRNYGYHGVRMAQVAQDAGIRKQSLAYHFSSKKDLFEDIYKDAVEEEISFVRSFFNTTDEASAWEATLHPFLVEHKNRFLHNAGSNYMFITSFLPPVEDYHYVMNEYRRYLGILKDEITRLFAQDQRLRFTPNQCTQIYITLLDGLDVQLVYENADAYEQLLEVNWNMFLHGIR